MDKSNNIPPELIRKMIKDRKIRKLFREAIEERHRLWLKVINSAQYKKTVK